MTTGRITPAQRREIARILARERVRAALRRHGGDVDAAYRSLEVDALLALRAGRERDRARAGEVAPARSTRTLLYRRAVGSIEGVR